VCVLGGGRNTHQMETENEMINGLYTERMCVCVCVGVGTRTRVHQERLKREFRLR